MSKYQKQKEFREYQRDRAAARKLRKHNRLNPYKPNLPGTRAEKPIEEVLPKLNPIYAILYLEIE